MVENDFYTPQPMETETIDLSQIIETAQSLKYVTTKELLDNPYALKETEKKIKEDLFHFLLANGHLKIETNFKPMKDQYEMKISLSVVHPDIIKKNKYYTYTTKPMTSINAYENINAYGEYVKGPKIKKKQLTSEQYYNMIQKKKKEKDKIVLEYGPKKKKPKHDENGQYLLNL